MKVRIGLLLGFGLALAAPAYADTYAQGVCDSLRKERPTMKAALAVTCHFPVSTLTSIVDRPTRFFCAPLSGGERMKPVDAESNGPQCGNPFAEMGGVERCQDYHGNPPAEDACLRAHGVDPHSIYGSK